MCPVMGQGLLFLTKAASKELQAAYAALTKSFQNE